jgi:hypothetical protein
MVQLAAGWGCAAHHTAGGQAGALHAAVWAAPPDTEAHRSTATLLATANATSNAKATLAAAWLEEVGAIVLTNGAAGKPTEASGAAGHGVRSWVES